MRCFALALLAACGDSSSASPDANNCAVWTGADPLDCVPNGMMNTDLNGTWTLTGTHTDLGGPMTPISLNVTFATSGTLGGCAAAMAKNDSPLPSLHAYRDDTRVFENRTDMPHTLSDTWEVCIRTSDLALAFHEYAMGSDSLITYWMDGVLTR